MLEMLLKKYTSDTSFDKHHIHSLIISPTRELAQQTFDVANEFIPSFSDQERFTCIKFVGGTKHAVDVEHFQRQGGTIVIATPGRFEELLKTKSSAFNLVSNLKSLVSDPAGEEYVDALRLGNAHSGRGRSIVRSGIFE